MTTREIIDALNSIKAEAEHKNLDNVQYELDKLIHNLKIEGIEDKEDWPW